MAALQNKVESRSWQVVFNQIRGFCLINGKQLLETIGIGSLEIKLTLPLLEGKPNISIAAFSVPAQIPDAFHIL